MFLLDQLFCDKGKLQYNESSLVGQIVVIYLRGLHCWENYESKQIYTGSTISSERLYFVYCESADGKSEKKLDSNERYIH